MLGWTKNLNIGICPEKFDTLLISFSGIIIGPFLFRMIDELILDDEFARSYPKNSLFLLSTTNNLLENNE